MKQKFNFEEMQSFCKERYKKVVFVKKDYFVNNELLKKLIALAEETSVQIVMDCFETSNDILVHYKFPVERECRKCNKIFTEECSKTKLADIIKSKGEFICHECFLRELEEKTKVIKMQEAEYNSRRNEITTFVIENYLNPQCSWKEDIPQKEWFGRLESSLFNTDEDKIAEHIKSLNYRDFLNTPYWKAVSAEKRRKAKYRCELCNNTGLLNVHHKTYEHHGYEKDYLNDLIVLCEDCHKKFHELGD